MTAAAAAGGGVVQLEPRVYSTCDPIIVPANVHLRGAGRGATIILGSGNLSGMILENAYVGATIAAVGAKNVTISDLTVDHATCGRNANGVALIPSGGLGGIEEYEGTPSENGLITGLEILGAPGYHNYMIWNLRGRHVKIVQNWIDGGSTTNGPQEGIESYGGHDVVIESNSVRNIGGACINLGSAGIAQSETNGIFVTGNHLTDCYTGIHIGTANEDEEQSNLQTHIRANVIRDTRRAGIDVDVAASTQERSLDITGNTIHNVTGTSPVGILVIGDLSLPSSSIVANTIGGNHIDNVRGSNAHGIRVVNYPNVRIIDNAVAGTDYEGIYVYNGNDVDIVGNRVENVGTVPIALYRGTTGFNSRIVVDQNRIVWGSANAGMLILGASQAAVRDNVFTRLPSPHNPSPIVYDLASCGMTVTGNLPWYPVTWQNVSSASCP